MGLFMNDDKCYPNALDCNAKGDIAEPQGACVYHVNQDLNAIP